MTTNNPAPEPAPWLRLWDKETKKYALADAFAVTGDGLYVLLFPSTSRYLQQFELDDPDRYILERCIGQRDSQGKWIFEGDVTDVKMAGGKKYFVTWENGRWLLKHDKNWLYHNYTPHFWSDYTVTGTIHDEKTATNNKEAKNETTN